MATGLVRLPKMKGMKKGKKGKRVKVRKICASTVNFLRREMRALQSVGRAFQKYLWGKNSKKDDADFLAGAGGAAPV